MHKSNSFNQITYSSCCVILLLLILSSCSIKKNLLFQSPTSINPEAFEKTVMNANMNYLIQKGDYLAVSVFPNKGEQIVDQTMDFPVGNNTGLTRDQGTTNQQQLLTENGNARTNIPLQRNNEYPNSYLVEQDGTVTLPQIGKIELAGKTLRDASDLVASAYSKFIKDPYVIMQYLNKRVIVMGALGDKVVALRNENMSLYEVIALASSDNTSTSDFNFQSEAKTKTIRIVRNYQTNPSVLIVDLTSIEGMNKLHTSILPNDIIYIEPRRKFDRESLSDVSAIVSPIASIIAIIIAVSR